MTKGNLVDDSLNIEKLFRVYEEMSPKVYYVISEAVPATNPETGQRAILGIEHSLLSLSSNDDDFIVCYMHPDVFPEFKAQVLARNCRLVDYRQKVVALAREMANHNHN